MYVCLFVNVAPMKSKQKICLVRWSELNRMELNEFIIAFLHQIISKLRIKYSVKPIKMTNLKIHYRKWFFKISIFPRIFVHSSSAQHLHAKREVGKRHFDTYSQNLSDGLYWKNLRVPVFFRIGKYDLINGWFLQKKWPC